VTDPGVTVTRSRRHSVVSWLSTRLRAVRTRGGSGGPSPRATPPFQFVDRERRRITLRQYRPTARRSLVDLYESFEPVERTQGLPPADRAEIDAWLDEILDSPSVVAVHEGAVVGHAPLVADGSGDHELGLFVGEAYRGAGVPAELLGASLAHARQSGVSAVWLTVPRTAHGRRRLFRRAGFEVAATSALSVRLRREL
jgi:GNAT superfamily N-acetyltransferase